MTISPAIPLPQQWLSISLFLYQIFFSFLVLHVFITVPRNILYVSNWLDPYTNRCLYFINRTESMSTRHMCKRRYVLRDRKWLQVFVSSGLQWKVLFRWELFINKYNNYTIFKPAVLFWENRARDSKLHRPYIFHMPFFKLLGPISRSISGLRVGLTIYWQIPDQWNWQVRQE